MSARDRIIALLRTHPDGLDDDLIAEKLGLSRRQQANSSAESSSGKASSSGDQSGARSKHFDWQRAGACPRRARNRSGRCRSG